MQEDENKELEERKNKAKSFILSKVNALQYILLFLIILLGTYIRSRPISKLIDITTEEYISLELDSTLFLRYAEYIAEHGKLFLVDP
ncbi:MAG: hypothetical protein AABW46_00270, partial [Nanoarchaeota archaeon]